jgi:DNA (cytosine-5)-methyltransferase 1
LKKLIHLDLFSGIGGFSIASEIVWGEVEHIFCDNNSFSQAILKKHWPDSKIYGDIKELKGKEIGAVDLITGGFPCQPFSSAGKRRGTEDDRHLWPEMLRVIRETYPRWVIGENVSGLVTWNGGLVLERVRLDLEAEGYEVWPFIIPACSQNAPHKRDRVWIVAHSKSGGNSGTPGEIRQKDERKKGEGSEMGISKLSESNSIRSSSNSYSIGRRGRGDKKRGESGRKLVKTKSKRSKVWGKNERRNWNAWPQVATRLCRMDDGLPRRMDRNLRLKALGNAIVPQVAVEIMKSIKNIANPND